MRGCKGIREQGILLLGLGLMGMMVYTGRYTIFEQGYIGSRDGFSPLHFSQRQKNGLKSLPYCDALRIIQLNKITRISAGYLLGYSVI